MSDIRLSGDSSAVIAPDSWSEGPGFEPPTRAAGDFSSPGSAFRADCYFRIRSTPVLRLNTHTPHLCGFEWSDTVTWCVVEWSAQNLRRDGSSFTWHQPCNNQRALSVHHFRGNLKIRATKRIQWLVQNHTRHVRSESAREQRTALYKNDE